MRNWMIIVLTCIFIYSCQSNENKTIETSMSITDGNNSIVHYQSIASPLRQSEFLPNLPDTLSEEVKAVLEEILQNMVYVKGGTFLMGDSIETNGSDCRMPQFQENVKDFFIGKYEVTQKEWNTIMGSAQSCFQGDNLPMENITWTEGNVFMNTLKKYTGLPFRYPTEEEWEFAAKGGTQSHGYIYSGSNECDSVCLEIEEWEEYYDVHTLPVGTNPPNELGLYDMSGNVWEYTENDWRKNYCSQPDNAWKCIRGGSYRSHESYCTTTSRTKIRADWRASNIGMRLAL